MAESGRLPPVPSHISTKRGPIPPPPPPSKRSHPSPSAHPPPLQPPGPTPGKHHHQHGHHGRATQSEETGVGAQAIRFAEGSYTPTGIYNVPTIIYVYTAGAIYADIILTKTWAM